MHCDSITHFSKLVLLYLFFLFQAEDGIRVYKVTVFQTCALPICSTIAPLTVTNSVLFFDIPAIFLISGLALTFFIIKKGLQKKEAIALIAFYLIYAALKIKGL